MATFWSQKPFFYPIGNTPPVCLTQSLAPELPADILLLGCGDPRNILETVHFDVNGNRKLDFTCCDLETAVLARNILLLTAIADGISWRNAWNFFYHFFLDDTSLEILLSQCRKLISSSDDLTTWNASSYGKYIRFCTEESMIEIRQHWGLYLESNNFSKQKKTALRKSFVKEMKQIREKNDNVTDLTMLRAAGPINQQASIDAGIQAFRSFWETGLQKCTTSETTTVTPHVNPTFAYSLGGSEFNVHYRTNPVTAFHLSPALSPIKGTSSPSSKITGPDLVDAAMDQFSTWCSSFCSRANVTNPSVVVRIFAGDCVSFCKALRICSSDKVGKTEPRYSRPSGLTQISFTEDYGGTPSSAPLLFNIIDTSNLIDHVGLPILILATSPLLQRTPWSTLQTDTFMGSASDGTMELALVERMCCDIPTISILLGITPSFHLHPFSTEGRKNEQVAVGVMENGNFYQRISWKCPSSVASYSAPAYPEIQEESPILVCDDVLLAKFMFSVYKRMFADENIANLANKATRSKAKYMLYIRISFVEFLSFVKERVQVDWNKTMQHLVDLMESDNTLLLGKTNYQDMICQLYLYDLYTIDTLRWDYLRSVRSPGDYFDGWQVVPPVVSVVLVVPRESVKVLEDNDRMEVGMPMLCCDTQGVNRQNMHSSVRLTFGDVAFSGQHGDARVVITEDPAGWHGKSPLIFSFDAPSWLFTKSGGIQTVGLYLRPTPIFTKKLFSQIGLNMRLFSAPLTDKKHVFITRHRPNDSREICKATDKASLNTVPNKSPFITVDFNASATRFESLSVRNNIVDPNAAKTLASGVPISTKVIGDSAVLASFEGYSQFFHFPFPIDTDKVKTKIARKSLYIEIVAPLRREIDTFVTASLNLFPVARSKTSFNLLNMSYLKLSELPTLRLPLSSSNTQPLSFHLLLTLSDQERVRQQSTRPAEEKGMIVNLKESIAAILIKSSEFGVPLTFTLSNPTLGGYAFIIVNDLKLDLTSQTVVADACVIPLNKDNLFEVVETINSKKESIAISTLDDEVRAWKCLLPAFVERCRTWEHGDMCEYRTRGIPACSPDDPWDNNTSPLCSCGLGKDLGAFGMVKDWKTIRSEATRLAISPLFPLLPLQKSLNDIHKEDNGKDSCAQCGGSGQPKLLACGRCKKIQYCSQKCQKSHWKQHKADCTAVQK